MPHRDWRLRVEDILTAVRAIESYVKGMTFDSFVTDRKAVDAVVWNITIIGEAARHVGPEIQRQYPQIPWDQMREIRNFIVHHYFGIDLPVVWKTVQENLPPLIAQLEGLLEENRRQPQDDHDRGSSA